MRNPNSKIARTLEASSAYVAAFKSKDVQAINAWIKSNGLLDLTNDEFVSFIDKVKASAT